LKTKIIEAVAFRSSVEIDDEGKIIKASKSFSNFINQPLSTLAKVLNNQKSKFHSITIEDVEEN
jgi:hypothetical protein